MSHRSDKATGNAIGCLIVVGGLLWLFATYPVPACLVAAALIVKIIADSRPRRCQLCGNILKRTAYVWDLDKKKKTICPRCNTSLERKASKVATKRIKT